MARRFGEVEMAKLGSALRGMAARASASAGSAWRSLGRAGPPLRAAFRAAFGEVNWHAPRWPAALGQTVAALVRRAAELVRAYPRRFAVGGGVALVVIGAAGYGYWWYQNLPRPIEVAFDVQAPALTPLEQPNPKPYPLTLKFGDSVAPLALVGKEAGAGIDVQPRVEGRWTWSDDRTLVFQPRADWPIGTEYSVAFERSVVGEHVRLRAYRFKFSTVAFGARITEARFYQDPADPAAKRIVATVKFTHPVDPAALESRIVLRQKGQKSGFLGIGAEQTRFRVTYDKLKLHAYIHSEPLPLPAKETAADLAIDAGVRAARGGPATADALAETVVIPGLYSLRVRNLAATHVDNDRAELDRVLMLTLSADVHERALAGAVRAWLLPVHHPGTAPEHRKHPYRWVDPAKIGPEILSESEPVALAPIAGERETVDTHSFKFDADAGRFMLVRVSGGIKSFGGYVLEKDHDQIVPIQRFPRHLRILSHGALLALSGERKVPVMARGVEGLRFEIGRLLPHQLQHLVTMSGGAFQRPMFHHPFNESNLVERFGQVLELPPNPAGRPSYHGLDLGQYLDPADRRGVFLLRVESYDPKTKRATGAADQRLVVVTDLGVLVKTAVDGSQDAFVQSIQTGQPVAGATVELIGRNGLAVLSQATDAGGRARFPALKGFEREREPVAYVVRKGGDVSFLPRGRGDRALDLSRFDVGGVSDTADAGKLSAYLFSDRGIYRPGDELRFGMIVKAADWTKRLEGLPLFAELTDARGVAIRRELVKLPQGGFDELRHATQDVAPTGNYTLTLYTVKDGRRDSQLGAVQVKVQEFLPDRLKMSVRMNQESPQGWVSPEGLKARVNLQNLFGTPAEGRDVKAQLTLSPAFPSFPGFRDFRFHDPQYAKEGFGEELTPAKTNDRGEAELELNLQRFARATYRVHLIAQGFEADGGRGVTAEAAQLVSHMPFLVGYKPDGDLGHVARGAKRSVELVAIDPQVRRTAVKDLTLVRVEQKYVSVLTRQDNGTFKYESRRKETELERTPLAIAESGAALALAADEPGRFAYLVRDAQGQTLARIEYGVAGKANLTRSLERNAELELTLNRQDYKPDDEIELQILAPYVGSGLITIERDRVYAHAWFKTTTTSSVQRIRVPRELEGNGYVSVTFIRDPGSPEIYTSPLSYAVKPFSVALDARRTKIAIDAPELAQPGDTLRLRHRADRPARIVVFAIDEGILQVARYRTPDPLGHFFQKRSLGVQTAQILDLILPEFKHLMAAAPGGDAEGALGRNLNPFKRKRDKPVTFWSGIVDTGPAGGELSYTVPDYFNGTLRVMAVAVSEGALGVHEAKTLVRGDFILSPNLPATVSPGDEFEASVGVANNVVGSGPSAKVTVDVATSPHLEVIGPASAELAIGELRESAATFRLRARTRLGGATVVFTASSGRKSGRSATGISVRPANPYVTELAAGSLRDGTVDVPVTRDMHGEFRKLEASVSHLPLGLAHGLASYLGAFPYSCTEQLVSQGMPAVVLGARPEFGRVRSAEGKSLADVIAVLRARQNPEGGFGLWAANQHVVEWVSVYAQHFLLEARDRGQPVPADLIASGNDYLRRLAGAEGEMLHDERARAYAIYLLTRQGIVTSNFAAALQKRLEEGHEKVWRKDIAAGYLAASYKLMKQDRAAERLIDGVETGTERRFEHYYDGLGHDAQALYLVAKHFPERAKRLPPGALQGILKQVQRGGYNTLSSAYTILALDAYATTVGEGAGGKLSIAEVLRDGKHRAHDLPPGLFPRVPFGADAAQIRFGATGDFAAYYVVAQTGFDRSPPATEVKNGIEVIREYASRNGQPVATVKLGDEIDVVLKFRAIDRDAIGSVALVDLLPGGFEVVLEPQPQPRRGEHEERPAPAAWRPPLGASPSGWSPEYVDVREDRVVLYGRVERGVGQFVYRIKATNAGAFATPPAYAESMYERGLQARSLGGRIAVEKR